MSPDVLQEQILQSLLANEPDSLVSAARAETLNPQEPDGWGKPEPIQNELPPVPKFDSKLLPEAFRRFVDDVADRMQVPPDYPAASIVLCLAGVVSRRASIQPKAIDTGWSVIPNLWGGIIAPPGFLKSPVIQAAIRPLEQIQTEWQREHEAAMKNYARDREMYELRYAVWKEQRKAAFKKKNSAEPERPDDELQQPTLKRLTTNDATPEALHQTMNENPAGILVIRDELTGWWSQLDRMGREGERAFCLQAWNGNTGHTIDRIGRGTIHVPACCMSMLGGIQPGKLRSYLADALDDGPGNDGLIQRFQLLVWPDTAPDWRYVDRIPDDEAAATVAIVFGNLAAMSAANPARFKFSPEAQDLFEVWLSELEVKVRGEELHPALISHLSKYRSLMPSLALLFGLADRAGSVGFDGAALVESLNFIDLHHAQQAAAMCEYLESHAHRIYSCITTPQSHAAQELGYKIKTKKLGKSGSFSRRDVYQGGWSGLNTPELAGAAISILLDAGWLREAQSTSGDSGGRPSIRYEINPRIWE